MTGATRASLRRCRSLRSAVVRCRGIHAAVLRRWFDEAVKDIADTADFEPLTALDDVEDFELLIRRTFIDRDRPWELSLVNGSAPALSFVTTFGLRAKFFIPMPPNSPLVPATSKSTSTLKFGSAFKNKMHKFGYG